MSLRLHIARVAQGLKHELDDLASRCPPLLRSLLQPIGHLAEAFLAKLGAPARATPPWTHRCLAPDALRPVISVLTPVFNPKPRFLREAIASVQAQCFATWELILVHDGEPDPETRRVLAEAAAADRRIRFDVLSPHGGISAATNRALSLARGEFVALLDHDDLLDPRALCEVAREIGRHPDADMIYSDEDKTDARGTLFFDPFFKPDWSPDALLSRMYVGHLTVYRTALVREIGGWRSAFDGSQDYDLALRLTEQTQKIHRIPRVLYHWRIHAASAAGNVAAKPQAYEAACRAIAEAIGRRGEFGQVEMVPGTQGFYRVRYEICRPGRVSIVICTRDNAGVLDRCLAGLFEKSTCPDFEVLLVDNGSCDPAALAVIEAWRGREPARLRVLRRDEPFNFAKLNNAAAARAGGPYLLFLNDDTELLSPGGIEAMMEEAQREEIGAVGAKLFYPDGRIQHAGVVLGVGGIAGHAHRGRPRRTPGYGGNALATTNYSAVTGACLMCRRDLFEAIGGFDEAFAVAYNDIDLCLRLGRRGYRIVWIPYAEWVHHESKRRGADTAGAARRRLEGEATLMRERWGELIDDDPCYNPNLTLGAEDFSLRDRAGR